MDADNLLFNGRTLFVNQAMNYTAEQLNAAIAGSREILNILLSDPVQGQIASHALFQETLTRLLRLPSVRMIVVRCGNGVEDLAEHLACVFSQIPQCQTLEGLYFETHLPMSTPLSALFARCIQNCTNIQHLGLNSRQGMFPSLDAMRKVLDSISSSVTTLKIPCANVTLLPNDAQGAIQLLAKTLLQSDSLQKITSLVDTHRAPINIRDICFRAKKPDNFRGCLAFTDEGCSIVKLTECYWHQLLHQDLLLELWAHVLVQAANMQPISFTMENLTGQNRAFCLHTTLQWEAELRHRPRPMCYCPGHHTPKDTLFLLLKEKNDVLIPNNANRGR